MKSLALLALCAMAALSSLVPTDANAQLFKKKLQCTGESCRTVQWPALLLVQPNAFTAPPLYSQPAIVTLVTPTESHVQVPCATYQLLLTPLEESAKSIDLTSAPIQELADGDDRFTRVIRATCRITVSGICGSGTVVGRDADGNALVLTNAHVAGTQRGRTVNVERWNPDGSSERGSGAIITAGYGRGLSVDFALLKCSTGFAKDVTPIPLADRYPDSKAGVTTYGCPRCEWPSLQVLKMTRNEGQVLHWLPEAIGGRSGSSLVDHTSDGPRVVGLLTWGGGGEGLGQSTPFLLDAMRGKLPKSFEMLPDTARELACATAPATIRVMPCTLAGLPLTLAQLPTSAAESETDGKTDTPTIDAITEHGPDKPTEDARILDRLRPGDKDKPGSTNREPWRPFAKLSEWIRRVLITLVIAAGAAAAGYAYAKLR